MAAPLHCSESYCDLHDYQINTSGICLRQDALRRSGELSAPRLASHDEGLSEAFSRLTEIIEEWSERQPRRDASSREPDRPVRREGRRGGTPL